MKKRFGNLITFGLLSFAILLTSGCASIFKGSSADVRVNSAPAGASVYINNIDRGETPQTLSLKRNKDYLLTFKKEGYEPVNVEVNKKFDVMTAVVGNIFSWGILGVVVDLATGSAYSLTPADLEANLAEIQTAGYLPKDFKPQKDEIFVVMLTNEEWESLSN